MAWGGYRVQPAPVGPPGDPGWAHVGIRGGMPVVYLGNGWVLAAHRVGIGKEAGRQYV